MMAPVYINIVVAFSRDKSRVGIGFVCSQGRPWGATDQAVEARVIKAHRMTPLALAFSMKTLMLAKSRRQVEERQ
jgi:hypothetical protein